METWKSKIVELMFPKDPKNIKAPQALQLKYDNIPKRLFKFCRFDENGYYLANLRQNQVWLCFPDKLNDPYDCALTYSGEEIFSKLMRLNIDTVIAGMLTPEMHFSEEDIDDIKNSKDIVRKLVEVAVAKDVTMQGPDSARMVDVFVEALKKQSSKTPKLLVDGSRKATILTSFSEINDSILMWSHYSQNHTGFCVEYDFPSLGPKSQTNIFLYPIIYQKDLTDITEYLLTEDMTKFNNTITLLAAITKSEEWVYEKEWRLLVPFGISEREIPWQTPVPTAVYLGSRITSKNEEDIVNICNVMSVPVFKARTSEFQFGIEFDRFGNLA